GLRACTRPAGPSVPSPAPAPAARSRAAGLPLASGRARTSGPALAPAMIAGGLLTVVLARAGLWSLLPGLWLLVYGAGVVAGGAFSVRVVPVMGVGFMTLGACALLGPAGWGDLLLVEIGRASCRGR